MAFKRASREQRPLNRRRVVAIGLVILLLGAALWPLRAWGVAGSSLLAEASVAPDPEYLELALGATGNISLVASNVTDLYGLELSLTFDPSRLQVVDADSSQSGVQVAAGSILQTGGWYIVQNTVDNTAGTIDVAATMVEAGTPYSGTGSLIRATWCGIGAGSSNLVLTKMIFSDPSSAALDVTTRNGTALVLDGPTLTPTYTATPTRTPTRTPTAAPTPTMTPAVAARVAISPARTEVSMGMTTTVDIRILNAVRLYGAEVHIRFDPTIVRVVDADSATAGVQIALGGFPYPDYAPLNLADNTAGTLDCAITQTPSRQPVNGDGVMARITFEALQAGTATIEILSAKLSDSEGVEIASTAHHGEIVVLSRGTVRGSVIFQGRPSPPSSRWRCPLAVMLYAPGSMTPAYTFSPQGDEAGFFAVTNITPGDYDVQVRDEHSLSNKRRNVAVAMGVNNVSLGTLLEGDADLSGVIDILDFSILASAFGTASGEPGYDARADFNNTGNIDILDFSLLATNYGRASDVIVSVVGAAQDAQLAAR